MKVSELITRKPMQFFSIEEGFLEVKRTIINARNTLINAEPPKLTDIKNYYPSNYDREWDQACYILRYMYAYSYEYFMLFSDIFELANRNKKFSVLSIGCGAMPDAWALEAAAKRMKVTGAISHTGVDSIQWDNKYVPKTSGRIRKKLILNKAGEFLENTNDEFDIILFPKSIGDMHMNDYSDFGKVKRAFRDSLSLKEGFFVAFSLINNEQNNRKDKIEIDYILQNIRTRGYEGRTVWSKKTKVGICGSNPSFPRLEEELVEDSINLTKRHFMASREYENYCLCKMTKVK